MFRIVLLTLLVTVSAGCGGGGAAGPVPNDDLGGMPNGDFSVATDPALPGYFGLGLWESTVDDHIALDGTPSPLPLLVWYPTDGDPNVPSALGPFPLIIFSHGASSAPDSSSFLTEHLTSHGFVVAAVQHPIRSLADRGEAFANRPWEVHSTVDFILAETARSGSFLSGLVDSNRLGVTGHSFGGLTTIALLGESNSRFRAGMPMAPGIRSSDPADVSFDLTQIVSPVMFMMSEQDTLALYPDLRAGYATIPETTERFAFVITNGTHLSFSNVCNTRCPEPGTLDHSSGKRIINTYGTAFFQVHLKGQLDYDSYLNEDIAIEGGEVRLYVGDLPE